LLKVVPTERTYDGSTFAEKLGITPSTLRNYKSQFTKVGITFKNNKGKTIYTENNLHMFSAMLDLHKQGGMTIAECVHAVLSVQDSQDSQDSTQDSQDSIQESVITLKQYEDIIKRLEIQEQELQKCKAQIERRDRQVTELMRQMQELRKQASYKRAWWMFWKN
jgi:DNA-binding transcriptional MerR regulator